MKRLLFLFLFPLLLNAQQTTLRWQYTSGTTSYSRTEVFDWQYGRGVATSPYKLAILKDGEYVTGTAALDELRKPIWGENGNQPFKDVLPVLTPAVPATLSFQLYPWFRYADTVPSTESVYGYEVKLARGVIFQKFDLLTLPVWGLLEVVLWRPYNPSGSAIWKQPNPAYPIIEAQRAQEKADYIQILEQTFTQLGTYQFPSFKVTEGCRWFIKYEGEEFQEISVDPDHRLASSHGGWISFLVPLRDYEVRSWEPYYNTTILLTGETRVKKLLGL